MWSTAGPPRLTVAAAVSRGAPGPCCIAATSQDAAGAGRRAPWHIVDGRTAAGALAAVAAAASVAASPWRGHRPHRGCTSLRADRGTDLGKYVRVPSEFPDERPKEGDIVSIHYVGTLEDGTVFDSSRARGEPFGFVLGDAEVIDGWDLLIGTMALGERADLVVPPEYAYGAEGMPPIVPPNATLTFDVELMDIGRPYEDTDDDDEEEEEEEQDAAETLLDDQGQLFWEKEDERESGRGRGYVWQATGSGEEIRVAVPLSDDVKVKDISVQVRTFGLTCKIGGKVVLDGALHAGVDTDDSHWDFERRGDAIGLCIYLVKLDRHQRWESLLLNDEAVDVDAALRAANEEE